MNVTVEMLEGLPRWRPVPQILEASSLEFTSQRYLDGHEVPCPEYLWAIDPAGNVVPVVVRSNRLDPYDPAMIESGADIGPFREQRIRHKRRAGFLFVDLPPEDWRSSAEGWVKQCAQEANRRRGVHEAEAQEGRHAFKSVEELLADMAASAVQKQHQLDQYLAQQTQKERGRGKTPPDTDR